MTTDGTEQLQVIFDMLTRTAIVSMGERIATLPGRVSTQKEADRLGLELARSLGWIKPGG